MLLVPAVASTGPQPIPGSGVVGIDLAGPLVSAGRDDLYLTPHLTDAVMALYASPVVRRGGDLHVLRMPHEGVPQEAHLAPGSSSFDDALRAAAHLSAGTAHRQPVAVLAGRDGAFALAPLGVGWFQDSRTFQGSQYSMTHTWWRPFDTNPLEGAAPAGIKAAQDGVLAVVLPNQWHDLRTGSGSTTAQPLGELAATATAAR